MNQSVLNKIVMIKHMLLDINVMPHYYYSNITVCYYIILIIYIMISELFYATLNLHFFSHLLLFFNWSPRLFF